MHSPLNRGHSPGNTRGILFASVALACTAYFFGAYSDRHNIFPLPAVWAAKSLIIPPKNPPSRFAFDQAGRLASDDHKSAIPCPQQLSRTTVLLLLGQSDAANHGGQRFRSEHGAKVVNFFDGQCFVAASPLLGSDGSMGEYWTPLGNLLINSGSFDQVILAPVAISGSEISRWARGGDLNTVMFNTTDQLR